MQQRVLHVRRRIVSSLQRWLNLFAWACVLIAAAGWRTGADPAKNVILVTIDGLRWQEVFHGAEEQLISREHGGVSDTNRIRGAFWRDTSEARRTALLPFFWGTIAAKGALIGNREIGSLARVTNGKNFTYPGFNEILAGFPDDRIDSNAKVNNPNVTVLEWLHQKGPFKNRVAAFANWDVFPFILNSERAGIPIFTGYSNDTLKSGTEAGRVVRELAAGITPVWDGMNFDVFFHHAALDYLKEKKPRVVWIAFSETDEWAHEGRYDLYLEAAHKIDFYLKSLWEALESMPGYRQQTALILTTDHGRGTGSVDWKSHGAAVKGAEEVWIAAVGSGIKHLGESKRNEPVGQDQIAATIARLLGEDYPAAVPKAGKPLSWLLEKAASR